MTSNGIRIKEIRHTARPAYGQTASGYGYAIPVPYVCQLEGDKSKRWRRVHVAQWSNAGSHWVNYQGARLWLSDCENYAEDWASAGLLTEPVLWKNKVPVYKEDLLRIRYVRLYPWEADTVRKAGLHVLDDDGEGVYLITE